MDSKIKTLIKKVKVKDLFFLSLFLSLLYSIRGRVRAFRSSPLSLASVMPDLNIVRASL